MWTMSSFLARVILAHVILAHVILDPHGNGDSPPHMFTVCSPLGASSQHKLTRTGIGARLQQLLAGAGKASTLLLPLRHLIVVPS